MNQSPALLRHPSPAPAQAGSASKPGDIPSGCSLRQDEANGRHLVTDEAGQVIGNGLTPAAAILLAQRYLTAKYLQPAAMAESARLEGCKFGPSAALAGRTRPSLADHREARELPVTVEAPSGRVLGAGRTKHEAAQSALRGVIVFFLQIDTLPQKNSSRDKHLQNRLSETPCAFGAD